MLWQPSDRTLRNVEVDEAGKLAAFRGRFGRGWDAEKTGDDAVAATDEASQMERLEAAVAADESQDAADDAAAAGRKTGGARKDAGKDKKEAAAAARPGMDALSDLISSYGAQQEPLREPKPKPVKKK